MRTVRTEDVGDAAESRTAGPTHWTGKDQEIANVGGKGRLLHFFNLHHILVGRKNGVSQPYFLILTIFPFNRIASLWMVPELNLHQYQAS